MLESLDPDVFFLELESDVFVVDGASNSALYDLRVGNIFTLCESSREILRNFALNGFSKSSLLEKEKDFLDFLLKSKIVRLSKNASSFKSILDLKSKDKVKFCWIEVLKTCNLECQHCYEESSPKLKGEMSFDSFKHLCGNLVSSNIENIQFIGGEPLLLKSKLIEMIKFSRPLFREIEIFTNGMYINDEWVNIFKELDIKIALSIHSYLPEEHDKVTKQVGSFNKTIRGLHLLKDNNIRHRICGVEMRGINFGDNSSNDSPWFNIKKDSIRLSGRADFNKIDYSIFEKKAITRKKFEEPIKKSFIISNISGHNCFQTKIYVDTDLEVFPCVMERRRSHGNLKNDNLNRILNEEILNFNKDKIEGCKDCEFRYACFDCRPDSNGKTFKEKPWNCTYDPFTGKWTNLKEAYNKLFHSNPIPN